MGLAEIRQIKNLKSQHPDHLSVLGGDAADELKGYWRRRPCKIGTRDPMTVQAIEWAIERRMKFPAFGDHARLILTETSVIPTVKSQACSTVTANP